LAEGGCRRGSGGHVSAVLRRAQTIGGMALKPATVGVPFWLYYFNIGDIDAAADA
jgi:predicted enzyme related to lactoylglutathione lyase